MEVYLVRHGQTDGNVGHRHQHPQTQLNAHGRAQAAAVATIIATLKPTHLICSTNMRAIETAKVIAASSNLIPETYPPFEELHQPKSMIGERLTGPHALWYMVLWFCGLKSSSMHDGESYAAFVIRLSAARAHLEELPKDARVVIVSHSIFINFFVEHMRHPKRMNLIRALIRFFNILKLKNTSIVHVRYTPVPFGYSGTGWHRVYNNLYTANGSNIISGNDKI